MFVDKSHQNVSRSSRSPSAAARRHTLATENKLDTNVPKYMPLREQQHPESYNRLQDWIVLYSSSYKYLVLGRWEIL